MRRRAHVIAVAVLLTGLAGEALSYAQTTPNKAELYKAADAAAAAGRVEESQKAYCQVAKIDPKYRDAKILCAVMTEELAREKKKNEERYNNGLREFKEGRYDSAQHEFANIRWGVHLEEAQLYLKVKIPQARQAQKR